MVARAGYGAKGLVYLLVGGLALVAVFGEGGRLTGAGGAVQEVSKSPFGVFELAAVGLGLLGYAFYRLMCGVADAKDQGVDGLGLMKRGGYLVSAVTHGALGWSCFRWRVGGGGDGEKEGFVADVLGVPGGWVLVMLVGLGVTLVGVVHFWNAVKGKYEESFELGGYGSVKRWCITRIAMVGLTARGVVFCVMGGFLVLAGWQSDSSEVKGVGGALGKVGDQPFGQVLLGLVAVGLVCYALYCWVRVIWGKF